MPPAGWKKPENYEWSRKAREKRQREAAMPNLPSTAVATTTAVVRRTVAQVQEAAGGALALRAGGAVDDEDADPDEGSFIPLSRRRPRRAPPARGGL